MEKRFQFDSEENKKYLKDFAEELLDFGRQFTSPGGSAYYLGDDGKSWVKRPRETWITSRMVHVYSIGSMLGDEGGEELALAGIKGLSGELADKNSGGFYAACEKSIAVWVFENCK